MKQGKYKNKTYPLRIDNIIMDKVRIIAEIENRPISRELNKIITEYVKFYEREHGEIKLPEQEEQEPPAAR